MTKPRERAGTRRTAGGGGRAGGAVPGKKGPTGPTGPGTVEPIRVPLEDRERLPVETQASEENTGAGSAEVQHEALEGSGAMEPPGWTEEYEATWRPPARRRRKTPSAAALRGLRSPRRAEAGQP